MLTIFLIVIFVAGITMGCVILWLFAQSRIKSIRISADELLNLKDMQITELKGDIERVNDETRKTQDLLKAEAERRAAAEERGSRIPELEEKVNTLQNENTTLKKELSEQLARIEEERKAAQEKIDLLTDAQKKLSDAFKTISAEALRNNNQSFLELAKATLEKFHEGAKLDLESRQKAIGDLVKPVTESLNKMDSAVNGLEKSRVEAYSHLTEQVKVLASTQVQLKDETSKLVRALRSPVVRGRWGEIQLRRVVEIAGMLPYCDFVEQVSTDTADGRLRPDLIVKLPGEKNVIVDAKAPLDAYLNAIEAQDDESKRGFMEHHAKQIRNHMQKLSSKAYWEQFPSTPEFVVMFLPGETFFSSALEHDPSLIEEGVKQRIILASPTTLIALLRAIAYGWRQETIAKSVQQISELGRELYKRLSVLVSHINRVGKGLDNAVKAYNDAVGSFETRVMVQARKFPELGAGTSRKLPEMKPVEKSVRQIQAPEEAPGPNLSSEDIGHKASHDS